RNGLSSCLAEQSINLGFARNNGSMAAYSAGTPSPFLAKGGGQTGPNAIPLVPLSPSFQYSRAELMYSPDVSSVRAHQDQRHTMRLARVAPRSDPLCRPVPPCGKKDDGDGVRHNRPAGARLMTPTRNRRTPSCAIL